MAGAGTRFAEAGFRNPKPLIDVMGKTMIQRVVENLDLPYARHIFIVQKKHRIEFELDKLLKNICDTPCDIVETENLLPGALYSVLKASKILVSDDEMLIANSDQLVITKPSHMIDELRELSADGGFMTFRTSGKSWSYALTSSEGRVEKVAEKEEISNNATIGVYYWKSSRYFLECAQRFLNKKITTNGEYYVSPVYNEAIADGKTVIAIPSLRHVSLGTPELLQLYLDEKSNKNE